MAEDKSNVCQVCLDMVKQARDQLESNETQVKFTILFNYIEFITGSLF